MLCVLLSMLLKLCLLTFIQKGKQRHQNPAIGQKHITQTHVSLVRICMNYFSCEVNCVLGVGCLAKCLVAAIHLHAPTFSRTYKPWSQDQFIYFITHSYGYVFKTVVYPFTIIACTYRTKYPCLPF